MSDFKVRIKNTEIIIEKLKARRKALSPNSEEIKKAFIQTGMLITNQAKLNIRRHGLIDTGRLINSLRWEFYKRGTIQGIQIGSFGVPYAAFWEFGFHGTMPVRAHNRLITRAFGRPLSQAKVTRIRAHMRRRDQEAKPYLKPAYELHKERIAQFFIENI